MLLTDLVREAFRSLRQRPGRAVLSALGSVLGVATVVAIVGLSETASHQVTLRFDELRATRLVVDAASPDEPEVLDVADLDAIRAVNGVTSAARIMAMGNRLATLVPVHGRAISISPSTVSLDFQDALDVEVLAGTLWDGAGPESRVAVIGETVVRELSMGPFVGPFELWVDGLPVTVTGVVRGSGLDLGLSGAVLVPESQSEFWGRPRDGSLIVRVLPGAGAGVGEVLPTLIDPTAPHKYAALVPPEPERLRATISGDTRLAFIAGSVIALLAGAIAIATSTLTSVVERTEEYGLRRALGARRADILRMVLIETTVLGALGGVVGSYLGLAGILAASLLLDWRPIFEPGLIPLAIVIGSAVGALAGLIPAARAAGLQPMTALRRV